MTRKHFMFLTAVVLIGMWAVSCAGDYSVNDTPINTAVKLQVGDISANTAEITLSPTQDVASFIVAGPALAGSFDYVGADAIASLAWIKENGSEYPAPFSQVYAELESGTGYFLGFVALDASGTIVSAPSFGSFKTKDTGISVKAELEGDSAPFIYSWSIEPNEYTECYKYIVSWDAALVDAEDASILEMVAAGGSGVTNAEEAVYESRNMDKKSPFIVAAVPFDALGKAGKGSIARIYTREVVAVNCNGSLTELSQSDSEVAIFEGEVTLPAKASFTISRSGEEYGFTSFSGNGGVGLLEGQTNTAAPCADLAGSTFKETIYKSVGRMELGGNAFWTNMPTEVKVKVVADFSREDGIPRYRLDVVESDPAVVLRENFELCVAGGYYWVGKISGPKYPETDPQALDGTEAVTPGAAGYTDGGTAMMKSDPADPDTEAVVPCELYLKNRDLEGWSFQRVYEHALAIRLGKSGSTYVPTSLTTPELSKLSAGSTISVEVKLSRLGTGSDPISIGVLGGGSIDSASYGNHKSTASNDGGSKIVDGEFRADAEVCPVVANADVDKPVSTVTLTISNAGPQTRISVYPCKSNSGISNSRCFCHGITITKK